MRDSSPILSSAKAHTALAGVTWGLLLVFLSGCTTSLRPAPDLGGIYNRAARSDHATRNPIIVIPGILGSKLVDAETGQPVWGAFVTEAASPADAEEPGIGADRCRTCRML